MVNSLPGKYIKKNKNESAPPVKYVSWGCSGANLFLDCSSVFLVVINEA